MRGNGLQATSWATLAEVDPQIADALLELLADAGVAAYAVPSQGTVGGYLDVTPHSRPTDKVFVDSEATDRAREVVEEHRDSLEADLGSPLDEPDAPSDPAADDATWNDLVDRLKAAPSLPATPDQADVGAATDEWSDVEQAVQEREEEYPQPAELDDDPDDHFVPPEPPPLPESDQLTRWAWVALLGGPGLLVLMTLVGWRLEGWIVFLAIVAFLAGFITLIVRMGDRADVDDDPDSGAVV